MAQQTLPHLIQLAKLGPSTKPALIVTSSLLPHEPVPEWFALSLVKAAQRNLMQSLDLTYGSTGVLLGLINVGGIVSPEEKNLNSSNIADKTWQWYSEDKPGFEVVIRA